MLQMPFPGFMFLKIFSMEMLGSNPKILSKPYSHLAIIEKQIQRIIISFFARHIFLPNICACAFLLLSCNVGNLLLTSWNLTYIHQCMSEGHQGSWLLHDALLLVVLFPITLLYLPMCGQTDLFAWSFP